MAFVLGISQTPFPADGDVPARARAIAQGARRESVSLLVFPENLMLPRELTAAELCDLSQPMGGPFVGGMRDVARILGMWIVFTISEQNPAGGPPFNTAVTVDAGGAVRGVYRKCHLYDAHSVRESDRMTAGDELCSPIRTPFCTLGLGICYDLRFPEVARALAAQGCDLIVFPAAWHDGPHKALHWETLLRARAIENECFVAGVCHGGTRYVGTGHVFGPLGTELASGTDELVTCTILQNVLVLATGKETAKSPTSAFGGGAYSRQRASIRTRRARRPGR